jgi:hypothetical protein
MERRYCETDPLDPITPANIGPEEFQSGGRIDSIAGKVRNARGKSDKDRGKSRQGQREIMTVTYAL